MKKKTTPKYATPATREELEILLGEYTLVEANHRAYTAELDISIAALRDRYVQHLTPVAARLEALAEAIASWAETNKPEFGDRRSLDLLHGTIGWRLGQPTVKTRPKARLEDVVARCRASGRTDLIRTTEALDKEAILALCAKGELTPETLAPLALRVTQEERFFITPKTEEK